MLWICFKWYLLKIINSYQNQYKIWGVVVIILNDNCLKTYNDVIEFCYFSLPFSHLISFINCTNTFDNNSIMAIMWNTKHLFVWRNLNLLNYQKNCIYAVLSQFFFTKSCFCRNSITEKWEKYFRREELSFDSFLKRRKRL